VYKLNRSIQGLFFNFVAFNFFCKVTDFIRKTFLIAICLINVAAIAQRRSKDDAPVTFEELYDAPYEINKLFVQFQPIYGEMFVANINAGFGMEVNYYLKDKMDFRVAARKTYSKQFDVSRDLAEKNSIFTIERDGITNLPRSYGQLEFGATYHIKDFEKDSETTMYLYKKSYKGDKWAARVPKQADIPSKVRKIYGARLGGIFYNTTTDLKRAMDKQDVTFADLLTEEGLNMTEVIERGTAGITTDDVSLFANVDVGGIYVGGSMAWIRNVAVDFDNKYQPGVDDLILTAFADIIIAPFAYVQDVQYSQQEGASTPANYVFNSDVISTSKVGFRLGLDGKFNRALSWGYGAEIGSKPTLKGRGTYALIKISFPIYSTNLNYKVEAFGK